MTNQEILELIIEDPNSVTPDQIEQLVSTQEELFDKLRDLIRRIFDINEKTLLEQSDATTGAMGWFNKKSQNARVRKYNKRIKDPAFDRTKDGHYVIVAEGDSWFQFPVFVRDVIDWLRKRNPHFAIYSIAYGGDWMTNMIYDGKYIEELSIHRPDVFLLSGGGNDLVGSNRIALMVDLEFGCEKYKQIEDIPDLTDFKLSENDRKQILNAQKYITKEFYSFLLVLELQYRKIISSINKKYPDLLIITHGYDYALPSYGRKFDFRYPLKSFVNWQVDSGKWLVRPLRIKGIYDPQVQKDIIKAFIFELNLMLDTMVHQYHNFYRVHALNITKDKNDWFDELHLKSHVFKKVAMIFERIINDYFEEAKKKSKSPDTLHEPALEKMDSRQGADQKVYSVNDIPQSVLANEKNKTT